jgi:hypothetical protein
MTKSKITKSFRPIKALKKKTKNKISKKGKLINYLFGVNLIITNIYNINRIRAIGKDFHQNAW